MEEEYNTQIKHLSGGCKRKLNIISSLLAAPKFLFLDEPTIGVDEETKETIDKMVRELNRLGSTVLWVTHNIEEA